MNPMAHSILSRTIGLITGRKLLRLLTTTLSIVFVQPAWAGPRVEGQQDNETFKKAVALQEIPNKNHVAGYLLEKDDCIIALPEVKTAAGEPLNSLLNSKRGPAGVKYDGPCHRISGDVRLLKQPPAVGMPSGTPACARIMFISKKHELDVAAEETVVFAQTSIASHVNHDAVRFANGRRILLQILNRSQ
jgi:hypothetical protein